MDEYADERVWKIHDSWFYIRAGSRRERFWPDVREHECIHWVV
jgi:hypothetical protein